MLYLQKKENLMEHIKKITPPEFLHWTQWGSLVALIIGGILWNHAEMKDWRAETRADRIEQAARTDKLYEMFVDLLKEGKG
jgi:hypothetical protein